MKTRIIQSILALMLTFMALPMMGQDYLKIYFKDGHTERHYMKLVESISATKYDLEGNLHSDYQMQQIVMPDTTYSYYIADIDSMSFAKVDEEQVKKNVEVATSSIISIFEQCSTIEEMEGHIDEIKKIDGIEDVWREGNDIIVQIRDWHKCFYKFPLIPESDANFTKDIMSLKRNSKIQLPMKNDGKLMKVAIAFQMIGDSRFTTEKEDLISLKEEFLQMGYDVHFIPNESTGEIIDIDFYNNRMFDYDIVFLATHGSYSNNKHYLYTSLDIGIEQIVAWEVVDNITDNVLNSYGISLDCDDISYGFCQTGKFSIGAFLIVSEDFIQRSDNAFTGSGPHFVYNAACSSLYGYGQITRENDGNVFSGSDAMARVFFDKGADLYIGASNDAYNSRYAGISLFKYMLEGASEECAFYNLDSKYKFEEDSKYKSALIDLFNSKSKYSNLKSLFLNSTHTEEKTEQKILNEYQANGSIELNGKITPLYAINTGLLFGFRIATEPNIDKTTKGIDIVSHDAHNSGDKFGEVVFSGIFEPEPGITYYYRATTYDGFNYNWGEERSFTIEQPSDIPAEAKDLGLPSGTKWASYNVGATAPEEYGEYFAWGELKEKDVFNESNYQFCKNGIYANIGDDIGGTEYDVARERWGGEWMIPNKQMMQELYEYCTTKWTTQNDVYGTLFTGPNGETIFLPAAGYRKDDKQQQAGVWGDYWASTASEANTYSAYELYFKNGLIKCDYVYNDNPTYRRNGHTVRPVIPGLQLTSNDPLSIIMGESETVSVRYGSGSYRYEVDKEGIVSVDITGSTITVNALSGGDVVVTVIDNNSGGKANISVAVKALPEAKDLGLPSGTKWASFNIGANTPEEFGDYFAWGESGVKDLYAESTYEYCTNGMYTNIGNDIRGTEYDTAREKWGGEWMIPSTTQFNELIANCTSEWTTINGVKGRKFISKINGEYIFFPAAGYYGNTVGNDGSYGYYWSGNRDSENADKATNLTIKNGTPGFANNSRFYGFSVRPVISGLELSTIGTLSMFEGKSKTITIKSGSGSYQPDVDKEGIVSVSIIGSTITINALKIGDVVFTVTDTKGGQKANITINVRAVPEAVDMGLPSGTKWANINVGANTPEEFGDYYAWGETEPKSVYTTSTYKYYKNSSYVDIGYDIRGSEYDAAQAKWGDNWKMPSSTQINELIANCTSEWTTVNGVNGCIFISKINGESIFLPAVGYCESGVSSSGTSGYYWACDKVTNKNNGYNLGVMADGPSLNAYSRYYGFAVRPVIRVTSEEDDPRMDEVVPEIIRDKFRDHMPIYSGVNPPNIEGSYLIEPYTVVFCEDGNWEPGHVIESYKIKFYNQSSSDNTIDMIKYNVEDKGDYSMGTGAFISGDDTHFTAYFSAEGMSNGIRTLKSIVFSGTKTEKGIEDIYYGFVMVDKGSDPNGKLMKTGVYRAFKDGDGISEPTTWEMESNARQMNPEDKSESVTEVDGLGRKKIESSGLSTDSEGRIPE